MLFSIVGALWVGHQQPKKPNVLHLDSCTLPCWIGIIPEKSTVAEAKNSVRLVYGGSPQYRIAEHISWVAVYDNNSGALVITVVFLVPKLTISNDDIVEGIELRTNMLIGDAMIALPIPDAITLWGQGGGTFPALLYTRSGVMITVDTPIVDLTTCKRITTDEHVQSIAIYPNRLKQISEAKSQKWITTGYCYNWPFRLSEALD